MRFFKLLIVIIFLTLIIISTFVNSINNLRVYFYHDDLYISIFAGLLIILLVIIMKFRIRFQITFIDISLLLYYLYISLHLLFLNAHQLLDNEFLSFTMLVITFFILKHFYIKECDTGAPKLLIVPVYIFILVPGIIGIIELIKQLPFINNVQLFNAGLHNSGATANFMASLVPLLYAILLLEKNKSALVKMFSWIALVLAIIIILTAKARSAWMACFISFLYISFSRVNISNYLSSFLISKSKKIILVISVVFLICVSFYAVYNLKRDSADGRIFIWNNCVQMVKEKPFFGSGYNSFIKAYNDQQITYFKNNPTDIENGYLAADARYAFNDYLEIAVESGIVGLSLFLLFILFVFKKNRFNKKSNSNVFLIGSKACVLSILVCGLFSYPLEVGQIYFLLFFFVAYIASANTSIFSVDGIASKSIVLVLVLFVSLSEFYVVRKFTAYIKWEKAFQYTYSENKQFSKASEIYKNIYPALKDDPLFLFNYGTTFSNFNEYEKSVSLLNEALRYKSSYDLYLNLGRAYEGIHADSLAEQTYIKVAFLVPHKFVPRYNLFKLYQRTNQERKAMEVAKTIKDMHIKVYSLVVGNIKSEAIKYLDTRNATLYTKCF